MKSPKFDAAYLRLTAWYVLIIMAISLLFSVWVYNQARTELRSGLSKTIQLKSLTSEMPVPPQSYSAIVNDQLQDTGGRLVERLVLLNIGVLVVGSFASYWLARRTMRPVEESVVAQERFTADASHELRTPLAAMKTEIEVGLRDKKLSKEDAVALLKSNLEEVDRLGNLADGLLALTQSDTSVTPQPVVLDTVTRKVMDRMRPLVRANQITVQDEIQPFTVIGDETAIDKIIGILLDNAIKYSAKGTAITLRTYQRDAHGYVEVQDRGIGIKASELPHIFDRFYRADTSRSKQNIPGHGLGLAIAQKLAEAMNATLAATSTPGKGSVFTLRMPLSVAE